MTKPVVRVDWLNAPTLQEPSKPFTQRLMDGSAIPDAFDGKIPGGELDGPMQGLYARLPKSDWECALGRTSA